MLAIFQRAFFEKEALDYPIGQMVYQKVKQEGIPTEFLRSHNRVTSIPGHTPRESFFHGKNTLVVGVRRTLDFATCKPSAHFQLPLVTGCAGICEYCYLNTQLGKKPYTRIYVNIEDILNQALKLIEERKPSVTLFEASAVSDPLPVEPYAHLLAHTIDFFSSQEHGRLRFVTKFDHIEDLLSLDHKGHTRIRFSINTDKMLKKYEHRTPPLEARLEALNRVLKSDYPGGVIIAPVFLESNWEEDYRRLLQDMRTQIDPLYDDQLEFEVISHRFTKRAKNRILEVFPDTELPMNEEEGRQFKYGQFGYGKYIYPKDRLKEAEIFFRQEIESLFPRTRIAYII